MHPSSRVKLCALEDAKPHHFVRSRRQPRKWDSSFKDGSPVHFWLKRMGSERSLRPNFDCYKLRRNSWRKSQRRCGIFFVKWSTRSRFKFWKTNDVVLAPSLRIGVPTVFPKFQKFCIFPAVGMFQKFGFYHDGADKRS